MDRRFDTPPQNDPHADLERAFIEEYLHARQQTLATLKHLPVSEADEMLKEASLFASGRLTEVESRAHLVEAIHRTEPVARAPQPAAVESAATSIVDIAPPPPQEPPPSPPRRRTRRWIP